ncbi:unnamed protein product [Brassica oleracea]
MVQTTDVPPNKTPPLHHLLNQGLEIFEPFSQEPSSLNNPRYYTSTRKDPQQQLKSITPETSPTKSSSFAEHADSVNAFAATATSKRTSAPILNFDQNQVRSRRPKKMLVCERTQHLGFRTKANSFRRFYRCEITLQRKSESHLFKWEDEAIPDEVSMVEAKVLDLVHDFQSLSKSVTEQIDSHKT